MSSGPSLRTLPTAGLGIRSGSGMGSIRLRTSSLAVRPGSSNTVSRQVSQCDADMTIHLAEPC